MDVVEKKEFICLECGLESDDVKPCEDKEPEEYICKFVRKEVLKNYAEQCAKELHGSK